MGNHQIPIGGRWRNQWGDPPEYQAMEFSCTRYWMRRGQRRAGRCIQSQGSSCALRKRKRAMSNIGGELETASIRSSNFKQHDYLSKNYKNKKDLCGGWLIGCYTPSLLSTGGPTHFSIAKTCSLCGGLIGPQWAILCTVLIRINHGPMAMENRPEDVRNIFLPYALALQGLQT